MNTKLLVGNVKETINDFLEKITPEKPIGFVSYDLDYYSSTKDALKILSGVDSQKYLPITYICLDDINLTSHYSYSGELLAVNEFNKENQLRKIEYHKFLENGRIFRRATWIKQIYFLHVLDHPVRHDVKLSERKRYIKNPYLKYSENKEEFSVK